MPGKFRRYLTLGGGLPPSLGQEGVGCGPVLGFVLLGVCSFFFLRGVLAHSVWVCLRLRALRHSVLAMPDGNHPCIACWIRYVPRRLLGGT